ncbi:hypothetical protein JMN32_11435 [Fulvivirga sp. 29W222]|uniref:Uncharacterized protein n=1 Tax=Fulvivirga marina TaxID=2494733 RepID=A0A937FYX5_9BACT|nr:hypothetical protein [Fulvivirga marina]MBL6446925.1 hypothetical protein [Fulvivirga marina]
MRNYQLNGVQTKSFATIAHPIKFLYLLHGRMDFQEYLHSKKIDSDAFKQAHSLQWHEWQSVFDQMHPKSFSSQKLFLINSLRHKFPYDPPKEVEERKVSSKKPVMPKPPKNLEQDEKKDVSPETKANPKAKVKPLMKAKPKVSTKPKIPPKPGSQGQESENKPKFRPKPVIKKRPKTD